MVPRRHQWKRIRNQVETKYKIKLLSSEMLYPLLDQKKKKKKSVTRKGPKVAPKNMNMVLELSSEKGGH